MCCFKNRLDDDTDRLHRVVITRNGEVENCRVRVSIHKTDHRNAEAIGFSHCDFFILGVDYENSCWQLVHFEHTFEVAIHTAHLTTDRSFFLTGKLIEFAILIHFQELAVFRE